MMGEPALDGERYKPSVNIARAPRMLAPLLYLGTAYVLLMAAGRAVDGICKMGC